MVSRFHTRAPPLLALEGFDLWKVFRHELERQPLGRERKAVTEHDQARAARTRRAYNSWRHHSQPPAAAQIDRDQHEAGRDEAFSSILAKPSRAKQRTQAASDACRKIKKEARR